MEANPSRGSGGRPTRDGMPIQDVVVVAVPVSDQDGAKAFYVDTLGFELVSDDDSVPGLHWIRVAPSSDRLARRGPATATTRRAWGWRQQTTNRVVGRSAAQRPASACSWPSRRSRLFQAASAPPRPRAGCPGQSPGKVAIRPYLSDGLTSWPALRDRVGPGQEPDANDRQVRTFGADRDFAGALACSGFWPAPVARSSASRSRCSTSSRRSSSSKASLAIAGAGVVTARRSSSAASGSCAGVILRGSPIMLLKYSWPPLGRAIAGGSIGADGDDLDVPEHRPGPPKGREQIGIDLLLAAFHALPSLKCGAWLPCHLRLTSAPTRPTSIAAGLIGANARGYSRSPNESRRCASRARASAAEAP